MMYQQIECPTCGNITTVKDVPEAQKCNWCRRLFKVTVTRRKKGKYNWEAEPVDFPNDEPIAKLQVINGYRYSKSKK